MTWHLVRIPTTSSSNNIRAIWDKSVEQASDEYKKRIVIKIKSFNCFFFFSIIYVVIIVIHMSQWH
jgi:hypothetical protein